MPPKRAPKTQQSQKSPWAGIQDVPFEILAEIFQLHYGDSTPDRTLALVCKRWRAVLLETPMLWRNIEGHCISADSVDLEVQRLQRRLELSKFMQLDISMSIRNLYRDVCCKEIFEIISNIPPGRWKSLSLNHDQSAFLGREHIMPLFHAKGPFNALQSFNFAEFSWGAPEQGPFESLIDCIAQSRPSFKNASLRGRVPKAILQPSFFQKVKQLNTELEFLSQLKEFDFLEDIHVNLHRYHFDYPAITINIPRKATFEGSSCLTLLRRSDRKAVEILEVHALSDRRYSHVYRDSSTIEFPELRSLSITHGGFEGFQCIQAPKLVHLSVTETPFMKTEKEWSNEFAKSLFEDAMANPMLPMPVSLHLELWLTPKTVLTMLKYWPQVQTLSLVFGEEFAWTGIFASALMRKKQPICPALNTLRLQSRKADKIKWKRWNEFARKILEARKNTDFGRIEWTKDGVTWNGLTREQL